MVHQNVGFQWPIEAASYLTRTGASVTPLRKLKTRTLHFIV